MQKLATGTCWSRDLIGIGRHPKWGGHCSVLANPTTCNRSSSPFCPSPTMSSLKDQPPTDHPPPIPSLDTSPEALHLIQSHSGLPKHTSPTPNSRVKRMSAAVEKTVEKTVDKLSRSIQGKSAITTPTTPPSARSHRLFSISRKGKAKDTSGDDDSEYFQRSSRPTMYADTAQMCSHHL